MLVLELVMELVIRLELEMVMLKLDPEVQEWVKVLEWAPEW